MFIDDFGSREFLNELIVRIRDWSANQSIAELFVKLATRLGSYMNYIAQYPNILVTLDREIDVNPKFRAFLKRQERTPATKLKGSVNTSLLPRCLSKRPKIFPTLTFLC